MIYLTTHEYEAGGDRVTIIDANTCHLWTSNSRFKNTAEKKECFYIEFDSLRKALMTYPIGHNNSFGAVISDSKHPKADKDVFFIDANESTAVSGGGSMAVAQHLFDSDPYGRTQPKKQVTLNTPNGLVRVVKRKKGLQWYNVPSYSVLEGSLTLGQFVYAGVVFKVHNPDGWGSESYLRKIAENVFESAEERWNSHAKNILEKPLDSVLLYRKSQDHFKTFVWWPPDCWATCACGTATSALATLLEQDVKTVGLNGIPMFGKWHGKGKTSVLGTASKLGACAWTLTDKT